MGEVMRVKSRLSLAAAMAASSAWVLAVVWETEACWVSTLCREAKSLRARSE